MADVNSQVALGINAPDPNQGLNTLSKILNLGQQGLGIRGQQSQNVSLAAEAAERQMSINERQKGAQLLSDPVGNGLVDTDGNPTKDAQKIIMQAMPTTGAQHYQGLLTGAKAKVEFNGAINGLRASERAELADGISGVAARAQSPDDILGAVDSILESKKGTPEYGNYQTIAGTMRQAITHLADKTKGAAPVATGQEPWRRAALNMGASVLPAGSTVGPSGTATPQATSIDTGGAVQPGTTAPALAGGGFTPSGPAVQKTVPPSAQILTDQNNHQFVFNPKSNTLEPVGTGGGTAAPKGPPPLKYVQPAPDQKGAETEVAAARTAGDLYGQNAHINDRLLELSKDTRTGPGTEIWHHALGALAGPFGGSPSGDYQKIGAYLDRQAALAVHSMGIPATNAGLETSKSISGTTQYSPEALQEKVKLTDALNEGARAYRAGLDKAIGVGRNQDLNNYQPYRSAWAANFDPTIFALDAAHRRGDTAEVQKIVGGLTPEQKATLRQKTINLRQLEQGQLPQ